jgi:hypothetical protein
LAALARIASRWSTKPESRAMIMALTIDDYYRGALDKR